MLNTDWSAVGGKLMVWSLSFWYFILVCNLIEIICGIVSEIKLQASILVIVHWLQLVYFVILETFWWSDEGQHAQEDQETLRVKGLLVVLLEAQQSGGESWGQQEQHRCREGCPCNVTVKGGRSVKRLRNVLKNVVYNGYKDNLQWYMTECWVPIIWKNRCRDFGWGQWMGRCNGMYWLIILIYFSTARQQFTFWP